MGNKSPFIPTHFLSLVKMSLAVDISIILRAG